MQTKPNEDQDPMFSESVKISIMWAYRDTYLSWKIGRLMWKIFAKLVPSKIVKWPFVRLQDIDSRYRHNQFWSQHFRIPPSLQNLAFFSPVMSITILLTLISSTTWETGILLMAASRRSCSTSIRAWVIEDIWKQSSLKCFEWKVQRFSKPYLRFVEWDQIEFKNLPRPK